jgi:hypothetical protein
MRLANNKKGCLKINDETALFEIGKEVIEVNIIALSIYLPT